MTDLAIATQNLRKVYGGRPGRPGFVAAQDLSLQAPRGRVFGLLGSNGAGQATLLGRPIGDHNNRRAVDMRPGSPLGFSGRRMGNIKSNADL